MKPKTVGGNVFINTATSVFNITTTLFSIIVMYFIYLFSREKLAIRAGDVGWGIINFCSKWYLIIVIGIFSFFIIIGVIMMIISFIFWFSFFFRR